MRRFKVGDETFVEFSSKLFNPEFSKEENFATGRNYILLKITDTQLLVEDPKKIFTPDTKYTTKTDHLFEFGNNLEVIFMDTRETSPHAVYMNKFRIYNPTYFSCDERVFFEALLVKHKRFGGKFTWSLPQTQKELGIKRTRRETIIQKFTTLGIIKTEGIPMPDELIKEITCFTVDIPKIIELIPKIYCKDADFVGIEDSLREMYL